MRLMHLIFSPNRQEAFKSELIGVVISGCIMSVGLWNLHRKVGKNQKKKEPDKE
jgi:hypothetical protein